MNLSIERIAIIFSLTKYLLFDIISDEMFEAKIVVMFVFGLH